MPRDILTGVDTGDTGGHMPRDILTGVDDRVVDTGHTPPPPSILG